MASVTAELSLIKRYHALSQDPATQPVVARRNTVPTLMKFVQHCDPQIRFIAAQTIELLASHPENPEYICREKGFLQLMYNMFKDTEVDHPELHEVFAKIFDNLRPALSQHRQAAGDENTPPAQGKSSSCKEPETIGGESARISKYRTTRVKVGAAAVAPSRSVRLALRNFDLSRREQLEELFQTVRGMISYSIDAAGESATLLLTTQTPTLLKILEDDGFECSVEEEVEVARHEAPGFGGPRAAGFATTPGGGGFLRGAAFGDFYKSLVPHGVDSNSLAERLKRQKEEQLRKKKAQESSAIRSFISTLTTGWW